MERQENGIFISDEELKDGLIVLAGVCAGVFAWKLVQCVILSNPGC